MSFKKWDKSYKETDIPWRVKDGDLNIIIQKNKIVSGNALDLGCGTGEYAKWLYQNGFQVEALDFSKEALKIAQKESPGPDYTLWDLENLEAYSFKRKTYDLVLDVKVFNFINNKEKYLTTIKKYLSGIFTLIIFLENSKKPHLVIQEKFVKELLFRFFEFNLKKSQWSGTVIGEFICKTKN